VIEQGCLDVRARDVLPAADHEVLRATGDVEVAVVVEAPQIAGPDPPLGVVQRRGTQYLLITVQLRALDLADPVLAARGYAKVDQRQRRPASTRPRERVLGPTRP